MREIVRWPLIRSGLILLLLLLSTLIGTRPVAAQPCGGHTGDLYDLPACALDTLTGNLVDNAYLTSAQPQTVIALPGENLSFAITYQVWVPTNTSCGQSWLNTCLFDVIFYPSWTHWPLLSPSDFYHSIRFVYSGLVPYGPPGMKRSASFQVTAPITTGTYFLFLYVQQSVSGSGVSDLATQPRPPGHIKIIVSTHTSTKTVTAMIPGPMSFTSLNIPLITAGVIGVTVAVMGSVAVAVKRGKLRIQRVRTKPSVQTSAEPSLSTGYEELDKALTGGLPERCAVVIVSPSYDERDLLIRRMVGSAISAQWPSFYVSNDFRKTQDMINHYPTNFYAFSPQADKIEPKPPNLYQLPSIDNLSDHTLSLSLAIRDARAKANSGKMLLVLDTLSDIILRHKAVTTRRWLTDFVGKRKAEGFTIVATLNPLTISKEEVQTIIDFFDGIIEIYERPLAEKAGKFLIIRKLYGRLYSESELLLDKKKLF